MQNKTEILSESAFWEKVKSLSTGGYCKLLETAMTLYALISEGNLSSTQCLTIITALSYFISPLDAIPDVIPLVGYSDDLALMLATLNIFNDQVSTDIKSKVKNWLPNPCQQDNN